MRLDEFDYSLPESFIAQTPVEPRDSARLMVLERAAGGLTHAAFRDLPGLLRPGDLLVVNDTRVIPARLLGRKTRTGGRVELLLLRRQAPLTWEALAGGAGLQPGAAVDVDGSLGLQALVMQDLGGPRRLVQFSQPVSPLLDRLGRVPLPPYIHQPLADPERYQTVFAREPGSAAAPTAGLHFTPSLLDRLRAAGVQLASVTLHVGLDTFAPVTEAHVEEHVMHGEWCEVTEAAALAVREARRRGGRVVAVGTTAVRTLESARAADRTITPFSGFTNLFIRPGHEFGVVDAMITNFHLPRSTLLMLVSAFAGRQRMLAAYEEAKRLGYRFYSFGDAMLLR